jgi:TonB family protein
MSRSIAIALLTVALVATLLPPPASGQQEDKATERKAVVKVKPVYPALARRMNISGTVKVGVVIAPNGSVKSTKVIGGNPLLVVAAEDAVRKWKYTPASAESTELVELKFEPR